MGMSTASRSRRSRPRKPPQLALFTPRGGKRAGAGRPCKGLRAGSQHKRRPRLATRYPVHVVLRASPIGNLRRRCIYLAIREATLIAARRKDFRIAQLSIQRTHVHLIVEASDERALAKGMQGFQISAARHINAVLGQESGAHPRRGAVFPDRYHAEIITSPRQARHTLAYVMLNWRKHREDCDSQGRGWRIDWYSSSAAFADWTECPGQAYAWQAPPGYAPLRVEPPQTWLLRVGWKKYSATISCDEVPSAAG